MLAAMDRKDIDHLIGLKGMPQITENTITNFDKLMDELQRIHRLGYAIDNQENEIEGRCIAAPITAHGQVVAALSISGPEFRMSLKRARALAPELRKTCAAISDGLSEDLGAH